MQRLSGIATLTRQFVDAAGGTHHRPRHAEDDAAAACTREVRRPGRRGRQPSQRPGRRHPDQGQPRAAGAAASCRRSRACAGRTGRCRPRSRRRALTQVDEALACGGRHRPARQSLHGGHHRGGAPMPGAGEDGDLGRRHARAHARARRHGRRFRVDWRADPLGASRRSQLRDRARVIATSRQRSRTIGVAGDRKRRSCDVRLQPEEPPTATADRGCPTA